MPCESETISVWKVYLSHADEQRELSLSYQFASKRWCKTVHITVTRSWSQYNVQSLRRAKNQLGKRFDCLSVSGECLRAQFTVQSDARICAASAGRRLFNARVGPICCWQCVFCLSLKLMHGKVKTGQSFRHDSTISWRSYKSKSMIHVPSSPASPVP